MVTGDQNVFITPAFEDYSYILFDLCDAMNLKVSEGCNIYPMNGSIGKNAIATIEDGNRVIVYDRELSPLVGYPGAMMIIGHELGHHFCHHISDGRGSQPDKELAADRFAGSAMRKAGFKLDDALAMLSVLDERPSKSHPARADRAVSITDGWNHPETGKECRP
ncbi:hypothetical protein GFM07_39030 [Rhizobium leguminosarum bv. viciae]|nr:hypothetical protein [Rhizobium leguminosarum bv. viciae]